MEVIETRGQGEKTEAICPQAGSLSTESVSLGLSHAYITLRLSVWVSNPPSKKKKINVETNLKNSQATAQESLDQIS